MHPAALQDRQAFRTARIEVADDLPKPSREPRYDERDREEWSRCWSSPPWRGSARRPHAAAQAQAVEAQDVLHGWYELMLELMRHTPTYTPPVASRAFAYVGVTAFEAVASGSDKLQSLAGQLNGLDGRAAARGRARPTTTPSCFRPRWRSRCTDFFANTGPTGQRAMAALEKKLRAEVTAGRAGRCRRPQRGLWRGGRATTFSAGRAMTAARSSRTWASRSSTS